METHHDLGRRVLALMSTGTVSHSADCVLSFPANWDVREEMEYVNP